MDESPHAARARAAKAAAVTDLLVGRHGAPLALRLAENASEDDWAQWATEASVRPLSARSRQLVADSLRRRANPPADPFAGL